MAPYFNGIGVTLILTAFVLLSFKKLKADDFLYKLLNFLGAVLACIGAWMIAAWAFVILEGVWCLVALSTLIVKK